MNNRENIRINSVSLNNSKSLLLLSTDMGFYIYHTDNFKIINEFDDEKIYKLVSIKNNIYRDLFQMREFFTILLLFAFLV